MEFMSGKVQIKAQSTSALTFASAETNLLQRRTSKTKHDDRFGLRTKLMVNEPGDIYEREADRIANQVMAVPAHRGVTAAPTRVQRFSGQLNRQTDVAPGSVDSVLASPRRPLEPVLRQDMEQRFGHDFSRVRVHTGAAAEQSAREVNANAYTTGQDIVFGADRFATGTQEGRRLIAHELTHVVQQLGSDGLRADESNEKRGLSHFTHTVSDCPAVAPDNRLQAKGVSDVASTVLPQVQSHITAMLSGGTPMPPLLRDYFEPRFGRNFSSIRLHTRDDAATSARDISARAFTIGQDIAFAEGEYRPDSREGKYLLAHELAHTVQQGASGEPRIQRVAADIDFKDLARRIFKAIEGLGTDEEAVYRALQPLGRDPSAIAMLKETYKTEYKRDLRADIEDDFSGEELEYALQLINSGTLQSEQRIERGPNAVVSIATGIERLWAATDQIGTDEEAIFATLLPFKRNTAELEDAFEKRYGENLRATLVSEMSGSELDYALELMSPKGERKKIEDVIAPQVIERNFVAADHAMARKILRDLLAVRSDRLDFSSEQELVDEIRKRMRTAQLMKESQTSNAFGYPESMPSDCPGYTPDIYIQASAHARVNKDARLLWLPPMLDPEFFYLFKLSPMGRANAYEAITRLFTNQGSFCDRTLIHCDFLITVIHFRAYAESIGPAVFNDLVRTGKIDPILTYHGFPKPPDDWRKAPRVWSLQEMRPASEDDLVIGDHVIFWNHLAYDALTVAKPGPWRLENALLVDKNDSGEDLYEGHGAPEILPNTVAPGPRDLMLGDLMRVYNNIVRTALQLTREVDEGVDPNKPVELDAKFPQVTKDPSQGWIIREREDRPERKKRTYILRELPSINDPELIGLHDPTDPSRMNTVKRPVESAKGPAPKP